MKSSDIFWRYMNRTLTNVRCLCWNMCQGQRARSASVNKRLVRRSDFADLAVW